MKGVITKKHFVEITRTFGIRKALKVLFSRRPVALTLLMV